VEEIVEPLHWEEAHASSVGLKRANNEDSYYTSMEKGLFIVTDGMGGNQGGEVASNAVVNVLPGLIEQQLTKANGSLESIEQALLNSIVELSQHVYAESCQYLELKGMGATVVMALMRGNHAHLAHMGDSRIYRFRDGVLEQLTQDHSLVALLMRNGEITAEEAAVHPARGRLSRYIGMEGTVFPDVQTVTLRKGDMLLLCSDGLSGQVSDDKITQILLANDDPQSACRALTGSANAAGGKDNVTIILLRIA
jgi:serine/threonine protein phosphatase PrpC